MNFKWIAIHFKLCALLFALTVEEQIYNSYIWEERETERREREVKKERERNRKVRNQIKNKNKNLYSHIHKLNYLEETCEA